MFVEKRVVSDAEAFKRLAYRGKNDLFSPFFEHQQFRVFHKSCSVITVDLFGNIADILPLVMGGRELNRLTAAFEVTELD